MKFQNIWFIMSCQMARSFVVIFSFHLLGTQPLCHLLGSLGMQPLEHIQRKG